MKLNSREVHSLSKVIKNKTLVAGHVKRYTTTSSNDILKFMSSIDVFINTLSWNSVNASCSILIYRWTCQSTLNEIVGSIFPSDNHLVIFQALLLCIICSPEHWANAFIWLGESFFDQKLSWLKAPEKLCIFSNPNCKKFLVGFDQNVFRILHLIPKLAGRGSVFVDIMPENQKSTLWHSS